MIAVTTPVGCEWRDPVVARPRRYTQKQLQRRLQSEGWVTIRGGKHVVKMTKVGYRPITIPACHGEVLSIGLVRSILRQADVDE